MNPLSNMRQLVYVLNALCKVDCLLADLRLNAKKRARRVRESRTSATETTSTASQESRRRIRRFWK